MKIHEHLKIRMAEPNEALPKISPDKMSFWRKDDGVYLEYPVLFAPVNRVCETLELSGLQEGDVITFPDVGFEAADFMAQLAAAGFLKLRSLGRPVATLRF